MMFSSLLGHEHRHDQGAVALGVHGGGMVTLQLGRAGNHQAQDSGCGRGVAKSLDGGTPDADPVAVMRTAGRRRGD